MLKHPPPKTVEIDGVQFRIYMLDATVGSPLYVKLVKSLGPALLRVALAAHGGDESAGLGALAELIQSLDPELVAELQNVFKGNSDVEIEGKWPRLKDVFSVYFAGKYVHMTKWLVECVRHNFADFFDASSLMSALGSQASTSN